jgi:hypothetical protein
MKFDSYLFDTLMRDLTGHDRTPATFLVYLQLYRLTQAMVGTQITVSHSNMADMTGLSKRAVQKAIDHLERRKLVVQHLKSPTSTPNYEVMTPWRRESKASGLVHLPSGEPLSADEILANQVHTSVNSSLVEALIEERRDGR